MPELPEVETVRLTLLNLIKGRKIKDVLFFYDKIIKNQTTNDFRNKLINQEIRDMRRIGKYLLFDMDNFTLVSHLRMEGKYFIKENLDELSKHEHIVFVLDNGKLLAYHDVRKFGTMELVELKKESTLESIKVLGREVNSDDLDVEYLYPLIRKSARPIKSILLDQHIITGLGNIYVDETLFSARIHPERLGNTLSSYQVKKIIKSAKAVIKKAIELGGTTIRTYQSSLGVDGRFQNELNVHTLAGKKCKNCNDIIKKIRVGGRGTYYCPTCQRNYNSLVIGLTGGIASGKSVISDWFIKRKVKVLDADKIYKNLLKTNEIMYNEIVDEFGQDVVKDNKIDTLSLGKIVFSDKKKRLRLNAITHPYVIVEMRLQIKSLIKDGNKLIILDVPLLYETKIEYMSDLVMLAFAKKETQIKRLMKRDNIDEAVAKTKISSQYTLENKKKKADIIINNNDTIEKTNKQLLNIYKELRSEGYVI